MLIFYDLKQLSAAVTALSNLVRRANKRAWSGNAPHQVGIGVESLLPI
jgi:hypothetical protein